jgi:antitoxin HicB
MSKKHMGSSIDDFMKEEGVFEEAQTQAIKEVVAWQAEEDLQESDGNVAKDEPHTSGLVA